MPCVNLSLEPSPASVGLEPAVSLYIHVPFCASKCHYCAFFSEIPKDQWPDRYVKALIRELEQLGGQIKPRTIFFGGGTPSVLAEVHWRQILNAMERCQLHKAQEWTVECNPASVSSEKARLWIEGGVNRISMGMQTQDDVLLGRLGRIHSYGRARECHDLLRRAGFQNLNIDLMFGIPGQTLEDWDRCISEALALGSEHLSCYEVTYEEDTPLYNQLQAGRFAMDEDLVCRMYQHLLVRVRDAGFRQYEISNFAKNHGPAPEGLPSEACLHNVNYWRGGYYIGLGPSASSYWDGLRTTRWPDVAKYCECVERGLSPLAEQDRLSPLARAGEIAAFGLRMTEGWDFNEFARITGFDLRTEWAVEMKELVLHEWGCLTDERFGLTAQGLRFADAAAEKFLRLE